MKNIVEKVDNSVDYIKKRYSKNIPSIAVVLGSGLGEFVDALSNKIIIPFEEIPGFPETTVEGHKGQIVIGCVNGIEILVLQGRLHYYEGHTIAEVVHPIRTLGSLGVKKIVLTNAAGGIAKGLSPGMFMLIEDHINLLGQNPLIGQNHNDWGPRFPDMTEVYKKTLVDEMLDLAKGNKIPTAKGVYAAVSGPNYETPAEVQYLKTIGVDAVGMSTVPEAIVSRHMGMEVFGISCVTNLAAGLSSGKLSHEEVGKVADLAKDNFKKLLCLLISLWSDFKIHG